MTAIKSHTELEVYVAAFEAAMDLFRLSKDFPKEETYSLTDQIRRASRSGCANLAEAWRKRRYEAHFLSKLSDSESEAAEVQTWLQFCAECEYPDRDLARELYKKYEKIIGKLVTMINNPTPWILK